MESTNTFCQNNIVKFDNEKDLKNNDYYTAIDYDTPNIGEYDDDEYFEDGSLNEDEVDDDGEPIEKSLPRVKGDDELFDEFGNPNYRYDDDDEPDDDDESVRNGWSDNVDKGFE